ncbi:MAG: tetratricopeptide repeat protein [Gemmatimonadota bacterium]
MTACGEGPPEAGEVLPGAAGAGEASGISALEVARTPGEMGYVGSERCTPCHEAVAASYQATPKARALGPFQVDRAPEVFADAGWVHQPADDLRYQARLTGTSLVQHEVRLDEAGQEVYRRSHPASLVIGSGQATRSYLMVENGTVTQMPLTWYSQSRRWDMSPGYHEANDRFGRRIGGECLYCHTDPVTAEPFTQNVFREIPDQGIGCERCHGPGEEHVRARESGEELPSPDPTVVNPSLLPREEAMAACQQCHLAGVTVVNPGQELRDFRPGRRLAENRRVFVPELQFDDPNWVGIDSHPLRLARSACFQGSEMTCMSCHTPHTAPQDLDPGHYDARCLNCHLEMSPSGAICGRDGAPEHGASDGGCVGCHMSQGGTSDVPHVRFTDHWIRKTLPPPLDPSQGRPAFDDPTPLELVEATALGLRASTPPPAASLAAAYLHFWETMHRVPTYITRVVTEGERARSQGLLHSDGRLALARARLERGEVAEARALLVQAVTEAAPGDPWPHLLLGSLLLERQDAPGEALPFLQRAVSQQPRFMEARIKLAEALVDLGRNDEAEQQLVAVVEAEPNQQPRAWFNLAVLRGMRGDEISAREAFRQAGELDPDLVEAHLQYGGLELNRGGLDAADTAFRRALAAAPELPAVHGSLALLAMARNHDAQARRHLARLLELDPGNPQALELLEALDGR